MKILTLNTNSLLEENYSEKLEQFVAGILDEMPDIIALQEVSQTAHEREIPLSMLEGQYPIPGCMKIRRDNHAAQVAYRLNQAGVKCSWAWIPVKRGHDRYDEGVAILSLGKKIRCVDQFPVSKVNDYYDGRTRAVLGVQLEDSDDWFYTVQMGSWNDGDETFLDQWKKLNCCIASRKLCDRVWLLGDFNASDRVRGESYDAIEASGWIDTHRAAVRRDAEMTVPAGFRQDYIWCSKHVEVSSSRVIFNGVTGPAVSDHYGILIEIKE